MLYIYSDFRLCHSFEYSVHCPPSMKVFFDWLEISYHLYLAINVYQKTGKQRSVLHGQFAFFQIGFKEGHDISTYNKMIFKLLFSAEAFAGYFGENWNRRVVGRLGRGKKHARDYGKRGKAWASLRLFPLPIISRALLPSPQPPYNTRELKNQRRRRLRKRHLKVNSRCFKFYRAYSISFNSSNLFGVDF